MTNTDIHTIFGAGQIGIQLARILAAKGTSVRLVRRGAAGPEIPGVVWLRGDLTDASFADDACRGARVVYNCVNPPHYHRWDEQLPPLTRGVLGAATRAGARLVALDNLYMYGRPEAVPFDESAPMQPCSDKGVLRARLADELMDAHRRGDVQVATGRASDFFGPHTPNAAIFHTRFFRRLRAGAAVEVMGDPDQPHSYSYAPDVARGLAILGTHEAAPGHVWHLPVAAQLSTRALIERFAAAVGRPARLRVIPTWAIRGIGAFVPLVGAIAEMVYQWETPYVASDARFRSVFGVGPTELDVAIADTLAAHSATATQRPYGAALPELPESNTSGSCAS